jgi:hypothetical protein
MPANLKKIFPGGVYPVMEENGKLTGIFICPDIDAGDLSQKIVQEIQPVERLRRGA